MRQSLPRSKARLIMTDTPDAILLMGPTASGKTGLALELARSPDRLAAARQQVQHGVQRSSLFDPVVFTKQLEEAYVGMVSARKKT